MGACAWPQPRQHQCPPQLQEPVGNNCKEQFAGTMHYKGWVGASPLPATHPQLPQGWPAAGAAGQAPRLPQGGKPSPLPPSSDHLIDPRPLPPHRAVLSIIDCWSWDALGLPLRLDWPCVACMWGFLFFCELFSRKLSSVTEFLASSFWNCQERPARECESKVGTDDEGRRTCYKGIFAFVYLLF